MIDVHVLTHEGTDPAWLAQCLDSLRDEECSVHVVDNVGRTVGQGRAIGYTLGRHPYIAHVDSDDWVLPGVMAHVTEALRHHRAVCTMERVEYQGKQFFRELKPGHHLCAFRRDAITPLLPHIATVPHLADWLVLRHLKPQQLDFLGYVWRLHPNQDHHRATKEMADAELERLPWNDFL